MIRSQSRRLPPPPLWLMARKELPPKQYGGGGGRGGGGAAMDKPGTTNKALHTPCTTPSRTEQNTNKCPSRSSYCKLCSTDRRRMGLCERNRTTRKETDRRDEQRQRLQDDKRATKVKRRNPNPNPNPLALTLTLTRAPNGTTLTGVVLKGRVMIPCHVSPIIGFFKCPTILQKSMAFPMLESAK